MRVCVCVCVCVCVGLNAWLPESAGIKELLDMVDGGLQLQAEDYMVVYITVIFFFWYFRHIE